VGKLDEYEFGGSDCHHEDIYVKSKLKSILEIYVAVQKKKGKLLNYFTLFF